MPVAPCLAGIRLQAICKKDPFTDWVCWHG